MKNSSKNLVIIGHTLGKMLVAGRGLTGPHRILEITDNMVEDPDSLVTGLIDKVYLIPIEHISAFGIFAAGGYDDGQKVDTPHTLEVGKKWIAWDLSQNKGKFTFDGVKNRQGNFMCRIEGHMPGLTSEITGAINNISRRKLLALGVDRAKNTVYHIGWENMAASITFNGDTGEAGDGENGSKFTVEAATPWIITWDPAVAIDTF